MDQVWLPIEDFPGYSVSDQGLVRNDEIGNLLARRVNQQGIAYVGLSRDLQQHTLSVSRLVAHTFLPPHPQEAFDTPINLNGDRTDNRVNNLMWRPRWFARKFHFQFTRSWIRDAGAPIEEIGTHQEFEKPIFAAMTFGLIAFEIETVAWNYSKYDNTWSTVWPTGQRFRLIDI